MSLTSLFVMAALAQAGPNPTMAPNFTGTTATGEQLTLEQFRGKYVVLEWWNHQCPVVMHHYGNGGMQSLQKEMTEKGVVWISICSSAPGKQGHVDGRMALEVMKQNDAHPTHVVLDATGVIGRLYAAKTTPHMFVISPTGEKLYDGAIDNNRNGNIPAGQVVNYVRQAFTQASGGQRVSVPTSQPYGCSVKY